jgi:hypothetical protein
VPPSLLLTSKPLWSGDYSKPILQFFDINQLFKG